MTNLQNFTDQNSKIDFETNLDSHNVNHTIFFLSVSPIYPNFGIETRYINRFLKEMATIYARLFNQYKLKYHIFFSASFYEIKD